jgi:uncharacterized protein with HEPN domain
MRNASCFMTVATKKLLLDVRDAGESILQNTAGKTLAEYSVSRFFRRAVKREFEIIGEALKRLTQIDPPTAAAVSELRRTVDFRNRIIHGYDTVDDAVVCGLIEAHLPLLVKEVGVLLGGEEPA